MNGTSVCILTSQYPPQTGGLGHSTHRIANLLASQGINAHVVAFRKSATPVAFDEAITTTVEGNVTVHRVDVWNPGWNQVFDEAGKQLTESDVLTRYNREIFDVINWLQNKYRFDLFHAFFLYPAGYIATAVAKYHGIKSIVSIRGNDIGKYVFDPLRMGFVKASLENADYVTSVASSLLDLASRAFVSGGLNGRSRVILNSINLGQAHAKSRPDLPLKGPVIGSIGLFRYKKGLLYLFKALAQLKDDYEFTVLLAGDYFNAKEQKIHETYLAELGLADRTVLSGRFPHQDVYDYLQFFDILVYPSLFAEGCPLSMMEAMAMKRAIVAHRAGAIPEVITDQQNGLLLDQGDTASMVSAIRRLLEDAPLRKKLGEEAYKRIQELSPEREQAAWLAVYETVLGGDA
ncbi:MAG: glycosyltransferase family 4 protein [Chloroflexota bacterium]